MVIKKIAVIGSGQMGAGIALVSAVNGYQVIMNDIEQSFIDGGLEKNHKWLDRQVEKNKLSTEESNAIRDRLSGILDLKDAVEDVDLVIEAVIENINIKNNLWKKIGEFARSDTIFATNTSSLSITEMATASGRPNQFLGIHFFNPPIKLKIIEFIKGYDTSQQTMQTALEYGKSMGMNTALAAEAPGFIVNRLLIPQLNEAIRALQEGIANKEDIDTAMKFGLNHPMGPLTLCDFIGLDTVLYIGQYLHAELGERFLPPNLLKKLVSAGKLGRKSGEGFYKY